jgi:hypothetical protein
MEWLYTKNGRPLRIRGEKVFNRSGLQIGRIRGSKVHGPDGRYVGTIVNNERLIYRSTQSTGTSSSFTPSRLAGSMRANRSSTALWGEEPNIPD